MLGRVARGLSADVDARDLRAVLATNVRVLAESRGMTLNALADFAGVSRSQLFNVLACASSPSLDWIARLALALEVEPWELLVPGDWSRLGARL